MNSWLKFTLPGYYLFYSRLKRKSEQISWVIVFPLIVYLCIWYFVESEVTPYSLSFFLALLIWLNFYEIGYLENDAITILKEKSPTLRIPNSEILFIQRKFLKLVLIKCLVGFVLLLCLYIVNKDLNSILLFLSAIVFTRLLFYSHNNIRSRYNILTYHLLSVVKYWSFPLLFSLKSNELVSLMLVLYMIFPLPRTIEHAVKVKYGIAWLKLIVGELDVFRLWYYILLATIAAVSCILKPIQLNSLLLAGSLYFLVYRGCVFFLIKFTKYKRSIFKVHDWEK